MGNCPDGSQLTLDIPTILVRKRRHSCAAGGGETRVQITTRT